MNKSKKVIPFFILILGMYYYSYRKSDVAISISDNRQSDIIEEKNKLEDDNAISPSEINKVNRELEIDRFSLKRLSNGFSSKELKLIGEIEKMKLNRKITIDFVLRSRKIINDEKKLLELANEISKNDVMTKLELIRWIRTKNLRDEVTIKSKRHQNIFNSFQVDAVK